MTSSVEALRAEIEACLSAELCDNVKRRELHAKVELLRLDLEEEAILRSGKVIQLPIKVVEKKNDGTSAMLNASAQKVSSAVISSEIVQQLDQLVNMVPLVPIRRPFKWWYWIDICFRFVGVCMGFLTVGVFLALPVIILRAVDSILQLDPFDSISEWLKRNISRFILILSGVEVDVEGVIRESFKEQCALLTFSHASNLDGFLVSSTCPIRHYAIAKKELFYVPFFSWISIAIGGVPMDRGNRNRAVGTLKRASEAARKSKMCVVIAPEGTRSLTGQLLPFKKGVSHMFEELQAPIVPVVLFGGWDLYPVGSWVNQCGYVAVRYLKPILPSEVESRDHMMRLLRRRMLESLLQCPPIIGKEISWFQRLRCIVVTILNILFDYGCLKIFYNIAFRLLGLSAFEAFWYSTSLIALITLGLYIYTVYIVDFLYRPQKSSADKKNS